MILKENDNLVLKEKYLEKFQYFKKIVVIRAIWESESDEGIYTVKQTVTRYFFYIDVIP